MTKEPPVSIIVLNWNGADMTLTCLKSLHKNTIYRNYKTILVDNGSTDDTIKRAGKIKNITILALKKNYGFPKGMNMGAWYALKKQNPSYIVFVSNDSVFRQKNWLSILIRDLEGDARAGMATCTYKNSDGKTVYSGANVARGLLASKRIPIPDAKKQYVTANYAAVVPVKADVLKHIGLWDERYSPFWWEDFDLDRRLEKNGYKILYEPAVTLYHGGSRTLKRFETKTDYLKTLYEKNYTRYSWKHHPLPFFMAVLFANLLRHIIRTDETGKRTLQNPAVIFQLLAVLDLKREKTTLTEEEAQSRIQEIILK